MKIVLKVANPATPKNFVEIVNSTSNICNIFESKKKNFLFRAIIEAFEKSSKDLFKCPHKKVKYIFK
jgi:hypothetical protein